jgi:hypothetical protein
MRAPYEPRGADNTTSLYRQARRLKEAGIVLSRREKRTAGSTAPLPRVVVQRPGRGRYHPASKADIVRLLRCAGEEYIYGLRRIVLARAPAGFADARFVFGRLLVPGIIVLYEQLIPPWVLPGSLAWRDRERLERAGASIDMLGSGLQTVVSWPGTTLHDFMLFDVLMHEVAHHMLQQYTGKRTVRVARTADHEAFADSFAVECRKRYMEAQR